MAFKKKPQEIEVIDTGGAKFVKRKTSWIKRVNMIFAIISVLWLAFVFYAPLHVKNNYSEPIKKSIVVSMFFDLQNYLQEQYANLLKGIAGQIDLSKPIGVAIEKVKMAEKPVAKVEQASAQAKQATEQVTERAGRLTGIANRVGINTAPVDTAVGGAVAKATGAIDQVDDVTRQVNERLDKITGELERIAQFEIDKAMDQQIKAFLDKHTGLGTTLLTNYGIDTVRPWRPSTWPITTRIYNDLERSNLTIMQSLMGLVNKYFGYVAWGLVIAAWAGGLVVWFMIMGKYRNLVRPFLICPRCGHTYADKRTGYMLAKVLKPWQWFF